MLIVEQRCHFSANHSWPAPGGVTGSVVGLAISPLSLDHTAAGRRVRNNLIHNHSDPVACGSKADKRLPAPGVREVSILDKLTHFVLLLSTYTIIQRADGISALSPPTDSSIQYDNIRATCSSGPIPRRIFSGFCTSVPRIRSVMNHRKSKSSHVASCRAG